MVTYGLAAIITHILSDLLAFQCREKEGFFFFSNYHLYHQEAEWKAKLDYSFWQDIQDWIVPSIREI